MASYYVGYQELEWFDKERARNLLSALWYPTQQTEDSVTYLAHFHSRARLHALFLENQFPLVILSHGSRGHRYNQYYLAEFLARSGYISNSRKIWARGCLIFRPALSQKFIHIKKAL